MSSNPFIYKFYLSNVLEFAYEQAILERRLRGLFMYVHMYLPEILIIFRALW